MRGIVQGLRRGHLQVSFRKDESLNALADVMNVAQFVSFGPGSRMAQEYARIVGYEPNHIFAEPREAISLLMERSAEGSVNVRSFKPSDLQSNEFLYGLTQVDDVEQAVRRFSLAGYYSIVNETIDVHDGGVSGVVQGGTIEFAPDATPRCVEKPGKDSAIVASLPVSWGKGILAVVYGITLDLGVARSNRLEFTTHPKPRGWKRTHVLGWELQAIDDLQIAPLLDWPNDFSRMIGDKAFGLLLASEIGLPVPRTTVVSRRIAPFVFGYDTGSAERWIRTCPREQVPGKFTTNRGWLDPFELLTREDRSGSNIASILAQSGVPTAYSGAVIVTADGTPLVEGIAGEGQEFMQGTVAPESLPHAVRDAVMALYEEAHSKLGPVRFEWVHDSSRPWIVQLHRGKTKTSGHVIVPGDASNWHKFDVANGLEALRSLLGRLTRDEGVELQGRVGLTSHIADVLRKAGIPARMS